VILVFKEILDRVKKVILEFREIRVIQELKEILALEIKEILEIRDQKVIRELKVILVNKEILVQLVVKYRGRVLGLLLPAI
jgi:hypothetical protein